MDEELFEKLEHSYSVNNSDGKFDDLYQKIQHKPTFHQRNRTPFSKIVEYLKEP